MDDASVRVSDAEREQAASALREHLLAGRLTPDEFTERVGAVLGARVGADLARTRQDLPEVHSWAGAEGCGPAPRFTAVLFGHVVRRGRLRLRRWTVAASVFGDLDLDLREATIAAPRADVTVLLFAGNVDVYVPEGVGVEVTGVTVFGHRRDRGRDVAVPGAPTVRVRALGVIAAVDVWRVPGGARGGYGKITRRIRRHQGQLPG